MTGLFKFIWQSHKDIKYTRYEPVLAMTLFDFVASKKAVFVVVVAGPLRDNLPRISF